MSVYGRPYMETEGGESNYLPYSYSLAILSPSETTDQGVSLLEKEVKTYLEYGLQEKNEFEGLEALGCGEINRDAHCSTTRRQEVVVEIDVRKLFTRGKGSFVLFCFAFH